MEQLEVALPLGSVPTKISEQNRHYRAIVYRSGGTASSSRSPPEDDFTAESRRATARPVRHRGSSPPDSWPAGSGSSRQGPTRHGACALIRPSSLPTARPLGTSLFGSACRKACHRRGQREEFQDSFRDRQAEVGGRRRVAPDRASTGRRPRRFASVRRRCVARVSASPRRDWQGFWQISRRTGKPPS